MGDYEKHVADAVAGALPLSEQNMSEEMAKKINELSLWMDIWWRKQLPETLRKAAQYGSADLELIGQSMLLLLPEDKRDPELGLLLGITFYLTGKIARVFGQIERGEKPDLDSYYDAAIYAIMALRVSEEGKWL